MREQQEVTDYLKATLLGQTPNMAFVGLGLTQGSGNDGYGMATLSIPAGPSLTGLSPEKMGAWIEKQKAEAAAPKARPAGVPDDAVPVCRCPLYSGSL